MPRYQQSFQRVLRYSELTIRDYKICMRRTAFVEDIHKSCFFILFFSFCFRENRFFYNRNKCSRKTWTYRWQYDRIGGRYHMETIVEHQDTEGGKL